MTKEKQLKGGKKKGNVLIGAKTGLLLLLLALLAAVAGAATAATATATPTAAAAVLVAALLIIVVLLVVVVVAVAAVATSATTATTAGTALPALEECRLAAGAGLDDALFDLAIFFLQVVDLLHDDQRLLAVLPSRLRIQLDKGVRELGALELDKDGALEGVIGRATQLNHLNRTVRSEEGLNVELCRRLLLAEALDIDAGLQAALLRLGRRLVGNFALDDLLTLETGDLEEVALAQSGHDGAIGLELPHALEAADRLKGHWLVRLATSALPHELVDGKVAIAEVELNLGDVSVWLAVINAALQKLSYLSANLNGVISDRHRGRIELLVLLEFLPTGLGLLLGGLLVLCLSGSDAVLGLIGGLLRLSALGRRGRRSGLLGGSGHLRLLLRGDVAHCDGCLEFGGAAPKEDATRNEGAMGKKVREEMADG